MNLIVLSLITLGVIGLASAIVLYFVAQKFKVEEDPRIDQVTEVLPGANCGGCGFPGCRGFAAACVGADTLEGKLCPVGGAPVMAKVGEILGMAVDAVEPKIAVVRCNGTCDNRPRTNKFDGAKNCRVVTQLYGGETGCSFGCLGFGDCVAACDFDAIRINPATGLPVVDETKCGGCGNCAKACPKFVIELRNRGIKNRRVFVSCVNKDKGGVARKACSAACIGCGKCERVCPFGAIKVENNLAYIDYKLCKLCRKCVVECPTGAIHDVNFPTPAPKPQPKPAAAPAAEAKMDVKVEKAAEKAPAPVEAAKPASVEAAKPAPVIEVEAAGKEIVVEPAVKTADPVAVKAEEPAAISAPKPAEPAVGEARIEDFLSPELRVTPREKKEEKQGTADAKVQTLDL